MTIFDIYINGKYWGNVSSANIIDASAKARLLINQSNPQVSANKFTLWQRVDGVEFDLN